MIVFFFNDTATTEIYTLSLHDALPIYIIALRELQTLRDSDLDVHSFYTALSDTVRRYITTRFQLAATGQTTREFLIVAKQHARLTLHDQKNLGVFLSAADLVKFARLEPNDHTCKEAVDQAEQFITSTIPQDETPSMEYAA